MKAFKSPLILNSFFLINHEYHFIQPNAQEDIHIQEIYDQYAIEIDFVFQKNDEGHFQLFTKIGVNNIEKPLPGYYLFVEGVCIFTFDQEHEVSENDKSQLLHLSGLNICINSLRNILATITSNGPFGKYTLPSIDVNRLLSDKQSKQTEKQ